VAWLVFFVAAFAIFIAGSTLARSGDVIARQTGIGHVWIGALLLAGATSLPEITTGTAATLTDAPDLAAGGVFGSNMANMAILAIIALWFSRARVIQREALSIVLTASLALVLTGIASLFIVARLEHSIFGAFSYGSLALAGAAVIGIMLRPQDEPIVQASEDEELPFGTREAILRFVAAVVVILVTAPVLVWAAEEIADITGLEETFIGVLGLALATSLPELATSTAAVRQGTLDLAVGNLYGSNAMNVIILVWLDAIYTDTPLLEHLDPSNAVAGIVAVLLMMFGLTSMVLRAERRRFPIDPAASLILFGYVVGVLLTLA
jgi:cation:H+ antiporter